MNEFYFKINLNKYGELRQKAEAEKKTFKNVILSFIIFSLLLYAVVIYINNSLRDKVNSRQKLLSKINKEIADYQSSGEYLSSKDLERLAKVSSERIFWTKKLEALAEKTTDKIAITNFSFSKGVLSLFGITKVDKNEKELDLIYEFIEDLKKNDQISLDFPDIIFVKSYRDREKEVDILRFQIDCRSAEADKKGGK